MRFKEIKNKKWFRIISNKYVLIVLIFLVWMFFFDSNSYLIHRELNREKDKLGGNKAYFSKQITQDKAQIDRLKDSTQLDRFAREEYFMKKENEEIYIIEYEDSIPQKDE